KPQWIADISQCRSLADGLGKSQDRKFVDVAIANVVADFTTFGFQQRTCRLYRDGFIRSAHLESDIDTQDCCYGDDYAGANKFLKSGKTGRQFISPGRQLSERIVTCL